MPGKAEVTSKPVKSRRRRIGFRLAAVAVGLLPFVILEVALRAFDVEKPTGYVDPFVGFSKLHPQFEKNEDKGVYETTNSRTLFFGRQEFAINKPKNGFRVFCLGGSTVRGRPYSVETAFARWMQLELSSSDPSHTYEVVNCGGLSYASYRLAAMLEEVLQYQPDAIVLATGHNEFLEDRTFKAIKEQTASRRWISEQFHSLRTVTAAKRMWGNLRGHSEEPDPREQLADRLQTRLDENSGYASYHRDDKWRKKVVGHFAVAMRGMVQMCKEAGVPLILVHLGSNLRDCPPIKSELNREKISAADARQFQDYLDKCADLEQSLPQLDENVLKHLLTWYKAAEAIDGGHALLCYRIARIYDRLGDYEHAREYFLKAKDKDVCPLRMLESMSKRIKTLALETETPLVDARQLLENESPQGIPGHDFYLDHVHPTIGGHQRIARAIVSRLREEKLAAQPKAAWTETARRRVYEEHIAGLGENFFGKAKTRVEWLEGWAQRDRMKNETAANDARGYLHFADRTANIGQEGVAAEEYLLSLKQDPKTARKLFKRVLELFRQGRTASAEYLLERTTGDIKGDAKAEARFAAAVIALETGDKKTAAKIATEHGMNFDKLPADSIWNKAFPKAVERLRNLR